ncbi:MAG TPA: Ig-like domain-containing protein [Gemmatimonadaceae bacterium]|nr:Ig-like domain-containing protein [Gemmatimonadaceae bacterium]
MRALAFLMVPSLALAQQPAVARINVTPSAPRVVAGETLQLQAEALDAGGRPVPGATIRFQQTAAQFEGAVDDKGLVHAGAVGTIPVAVTAIVQGQKPVIRRVEVAVLPGPAATIVIEPRALKLLAGQSMQVSGHVFSKAGDVRPDAVTWTSAAPAVARAGADGSITAISPGSAVVTAAAGGVKESLRVEVLAANVGSVTLTPSQPQARTGDVIRFRLSVKDAAGKEIEGLSPTWLLAPGHGEIDADGAFVGYDAGRYTVTALLGARSVQTTVTLTPRDVRRPATVVGSVVRTAFPTSEVWVHPNGKVAYLGTHLGGDRVYVLDVADPAKPRIVDSVIVNARMINDVMTSEDGKVMVITREGADNRKNGIVVCTLDDPLHPKPVGEFTDGVTAGVHSAYIYTQPKFGMHVYLTNDGTGALHIVDIGDPAHPRQVGTWKTPRADAGRTLHDIDVRDGLLYASYWNDGLVILDIGSGIKGGSPSNPQLVSQYKYDLNALCKQVEAVGGPGFVRGTHTAWRHKDYVFIADEVFTLADEQLLFNNRPARAYGRLQVLDVSDIAHPRPVAFYEPEYGGVHNVWVAGDTLYMGAYNAGFRAFDISGELRGDLRAQQREIAHVNPSDPKGFIPNSTMTWGVVVKNGLAYVNDFNSGLFIVRIEPRAPVVP